MLRLEKVSPEGRNLLWNINQKYLYEMTRYYDDPMDDNGNYHYGHFNEYFTDSKRTAYYIYNDENLIGFAMISPHSEIGQETDFVMAEFTIFPHFRRNHFALDAARMILSKHPGRWEIKYNRKNTGAERLWNMLAKPYDPKSYVLNEEEVVLSFKA